MQNEELVDMLKIQGDRIENLVKKVKNLESKSDYLKKKLTSEVEELKERLNEKDEEISFIHRIFESS